MQKSIKDIINGINIIEIYNKHLIDRQITGIKYNSKEVEKGDLFVCLPGQHTDGNLFIDEAIKNGANAIVTNKKIEFNYKDVICIVTEDTNYALAKISANFYENPSKKLILIGVTGTNGKTTITYLLESIFQTAGYKTGVIGTINYRYENKIFSAKNTTPFSSDLQKLLYEMLQAKVEVVIMEVSSHSLVQQRTKECEFDVAIFSNLSPEHLDYHCNMEEYFKAKSILFKEMTPHKKEYFKNSKLGEKTCIINYDDEWGKKLIQLCPTKNIFLYSKSLKNKNNAQKFIATNIKYNNNSIEFEIIYNSDKKAKIFTHLIGEFNVYNILAAFAASYSQNLEVSDIAEGIKKVENIPGRLEKIITPLNFSVIIDYAHTPNALENVLYTLKSLPHRKLIVVFGCGGDRDRSKRPVMGSIATQLADYVIVTSDNPRTEDPNKILLDIEVGIKKTENKNYEIIVDRKEAIFKALSIAQPNDIVLLAGKGHENYQIIGDKKIPFDEREVIKEFFKK